MRKDQARDRLAALSFVKSSGGATCEAVSVRLAGLSGAAEVDPRWAVSSGAVKARRYMMKGLLDDGLVSRDGDLYVPNGRTDAAIAGLSALLEPRPVRRRRADRSDRSKALEESLERARKGAAARLSSRYEASGLSPEEARRKANAEVKERISKCCS